MEQTERIKRDEKELRGQDRAGLERLYCQSHRVSDPRGVRKSHLITDILIARYGVKAVESVRGWSK